MLYGYARVSSESQNHAGQASDLKAAGVSRIYAEKFTGIEGSDHKQLKALLAKVREGDVIVVTKLDRFARSTRDLLNMLHELNERGIGFRSLGEAIDTTTPAGKLMLTMLGAIAEFERAMIRERCSAGIARAKGEGRHLGRERALNPHQRKQALEMLAKGETQRAVARLFDVGQATIGRLVRNNEVRASASFIGSTIARAIQPMTGTSV
jgi:DNA invertase Pin-like site-specific DNA recombinase